MGSFTLSNYLALCLPITVKSSLAIALVKLQSVFPDVIEKGPCHAFIYIKQVSDTFPSNHSEIYLYRWMYGKTVWFHVLGRHKDWIKLKGIPALVAHVTEIKNQEPVHAYEMPNIKEWKG